MPVVSYTDFSGGINQILGPVVSDPDPAQRIPSGFFFCDDALNMEMSENGILKYYGHDNQLASALGGSKIITGLFSYNNTTLIACVSDGKIYTISGGTATQIYTGATPGAYYFGVEYNNVLLLMNGVDTVLRYNGTNCVAVTFTDPESIWNDARPFAAVEFRNRLFYLTETKVYTPNPPIDGDNGYSNFTNSNNTVDAFPVSPGFGGRITGAKALNDDVLVIYKQDCIRQLSGSTPFGSGVDDFELRNLTDSMGCIAPRTLIEVNQDHYFLSRNGFKSLANSLKQTGKDVDFPGYNVSTTINSIPQDYIEDAVACYVEKDNSIYFSFPTSSQTQNQTTLVYDVVTRTNQLRSGFSAASMLYLNNQLYTGDYDGQVYKFGTEYNYNSTAINSYWKTKWVAHEGITTYKRYRQINIYAEGEGLNDIVVTFKVLRAGAEYSNPITETLVSGSLWDVMVWNQDNWGGNPSSVFYRKNLGKGQAFKIELYDATGTQRTKIRQIDLIYDVISTVKG